jgi:glycosyltransferase involved in cell wall biosynthesis
VTSSSSESAAPPCRVLWLTKGLGRGGAERLLVSGAKRIDRSHFEIEIAYLLPWKDALVPELERLGVRTHCLGGSRALDVGWISRLHRVVKQGRFDLVHTHMPYPALGARTIPRGRTAIVHTEHNSWERYRHSVRWANRLTYSRNAAVIAVSHAVAASIRPVRGARKWPPVHVVHHGAELSDFCPSTPASRTRGRKRLGLHQESLVIGSVGNFTAKKDHQTLLEATARVARSGPDVQLVIVGTGPLEDALREATHSLGLTDRVVFTGSRDDVPELLPAFDVFALSSRIEGLPISLLEAMATGLPSVATSVGGVPEIVTDGDEGLLVPARDASALADALNSLLDDPEGMKAAGARAAQTARRFDIARAVRDIEEVYRDALAIARREIPVS